MPDRIELMQGVLDLMILQVLEWGAQHGHGIGQALRTRTGDAVRVEHGSLYPALHRLEKKGFVEAEWRISEASRRARYYRLTRKGRKQLGKEQSQWKELVQAVALTVKPGRA